MKVLDLQCSAQQHRFEGWFASEADYESQLQQGLLSCPLCADKVIHKLPSAARLNLGAPAQTAPQASAASAAGRVAGEDTLQALQVAYLQYARHVLAQTEDVGTRFAEEARKIHYGESEQRGIRGQTSPQETQALREEGINVFALALPVGLKEPLH